MPDGMLNGEEREYYRHLENLVQETYSENGNTSVANLLDQTLTCFYSIASSRGEHEQFGQALLRQVFPVWTRILDSQLQNENNCVKELSLREHCNVLAKTVYLIGQEGYLPNKLDQRDGETLSWIDASEWLEVAASIERVEVDTSYFDDSIMFCGTAYDYQRARSTELSYLARQLFIFNFVWGGLETIIKLIEPPKVPNNVKRGRTSSIDQALYYLKTNYEPSNPIVLYRDTVEVLNDALRVWQPERTKDARIENHVSLSGIGLSIVRRIRNTFAHGAAHMPEPGEYSNNPEVAANVIEASTRTLLYAIQTLLITHLIGSNFDITIREDKDGELLSENVHFVLRSLHVAQRKADKAQPLLFDV